MGEYIVSGNHCRISISCDLDLAVIFYAQKNAAILNHPLVLFSRSMTSLQSGSFPGVSKRSGIPVAMKPSSSAISAASKPHRGDSDVATGMARKNAGPVAAAKGMPSSVSANTSEQTTGKHVPAPAGLDPRYLQSIETAPAGSSLSASAMSGKAATALDSAYFPR